MMNRLSAQSVILFTSNKARLAAYWIRHNLILCVSLALFLVTAFFISGTICVFRSTIGIPCPGCGLSRSILAALRWQWGTAFQFHPLFWLPPLMLVIWLALKVFPSAGKYPVVNKVLMKHGLFAAGTLFIAVYIFRMFTFFPDTQPMIYQADSVVGRLWTMFQQLFN